MHAGQRRVQFGRKPRVAQGVANGVAQAFGTPPEPDRVGTVVVAPVHRDRRDRSRHQCQRVGFIKPVRGDVEIAMGTGVERLEQIERQIIRRHRLRDLRRLGLDRAPMWCKDHNGRAAILDCDLVIFPCLMRGGKRGEIGISVGHVCPFQRAEGGGYTSSLVTVLEILPSVRRRATISPKRICNQSSPTSVSGSDAKMAEVASPSALLSTL